jgi:hypothetical protein
MALSTSTLKLNDTEAVVKAYGSADNVTIALADLIPASQALDGGTQTVNINKIEWAGSNGSTLTIARGSETIIAVDSTGSDSLEFGAGYSDSVANTDDLLVTVTGSVSVYLTLRKVSGYANKVETAQFSVYDDVNAVGS